MDIIIRAASVLGLVFICIWHAEGNRGYSYADCTYVQGDFENTFYGGRCFCYTSPVIKYKDYWSTFQVQVSSKDEVHVVYPMESKSCRDTENPLTMATCMIEQYWPYSLQKERSENIPLAGEEVYFMTKSTKNSAEYTLRVSKQRFDKVRFAQFVGGLVLFFFAGAICRSSLFFYTSGILLGTVSILVLLLLVLKSFVPEVSNTQGLFVLLFGAGSGLSYLGFQKLINEWDKVMNLYWREVLGYLLLSGLVSFALCYRVGSIRNKRALNSLTWTLQAAGTALACHGVTYAPVSWKLLAALLVWKILPLVLTILLGILRQTYSLLSAFLGLFRRRRSKIRLLSEAEYREQGERCTTAALEELRNYCNRPGFPAWDTVLRLRHPQRFAEFMRSGEQVTPSELQNHDHHYGLGAEYDEDALRAPATSDDLSEDELKTYTRQATGISSIRSTLHPSDGLQNNSTCFILLIYLQNFVDLLRLGVISNISFYLHFFLFTFFIFKFFYNKFLVDTLYINFTNFQLVI
ncbi:nuclear envelope integral membrane protein 2 isoform X2 [Trichomycterus rosablanca]|uniref:nuclear envelope integral membrane protein 2 isoform X2 n=1 Tax=Trichomycterus rosablanca TaxID=2290929 RepID=UPI002F35D033